MSPDRVERFIKAGPDHHTPWGVVHGGLYATAIESGATLGASAAVEPRGQFAVGVNNQADFLPPNAAGRLNAAAARIQQGRILQLCLAKITNTRRTRLGRPCRRIEPARPRPGPTRSRQWCRSDW